MYETAKEANLCLKINYYCYGLIYLFIFFSFIRGEKISTSSVDFLYVLLLSSWEKLTLP